MANIETDAAGRPIAYDSAGRPLAVEPVHGRPVTVDGDPAYVARDPAYAARGDRPVVVERRSGSGLGWLLALLVIVALVVAAFALKLISIDQLTGGSAPKVSVTGGELPKFKVDTAKIDVGTKKTEVDTPTLHVEKADAANAPADKQ